MNRPPGSWGRAGEFDIKSSLKCFPALAAVIIAGFFATVTAGRAEAPPASALPAPPSGQSRAAAITDPAFRLEGPDALGRAGDYLLQNAHSAFVIEGLERINSYYYYGGILVDAAPFKDGRQSAPEQFEELGLFVGKLNPRNLADVSIRAFKGQRVEIKNDGSDGRPAVVRVHGVDEMFWISEMTLMSAAYDGGLEHTRSQPLGVELYVDYILPPDSPVLRIEFNIKNADSHQKHLFTGAGGFFGDATENRFYSEGQLEIMFPVEFGLPAVASSSGVYAVAMGMPEAIMGTANLSGFDAFFNLRQLTSRLSLAPKGWPGDSACVTLFFSVGAGSYNSALTPIHQANPHPLPGWNIRLKPLAGRVVDAQTGAPVAGADVTITGPNSRGEWRFIDGFITDADGRFEGLVPETGRQLRASATLLGRDPSRSVLFRLSRKDPLELTMDPPGTLALDARDGEGRGIPVRVTLYKTPLLPERSLYGRGAPAEFSVAPGKYNVTVTRGYEYRVWKGEVEIPAGGRAAIAPVLARAVDTAGYLSTDIHLHAGPSGDNKISMADRILTAAVENLEVVIGTDHEAIFAYEGVPAATGLAPWVAAVTGEEVTATIPEHINAFPFSPRFDLDLRGGPVKWHGLDIDQVYAAIRDRGAQIIQLNHPRGYLSLSEYDPATGTAKMQHPEYVALPPDAKMWSWNFDAIELMNGLDPIMWRGRRYSMFDYWMSFINAGHRITATGNTDAHDWHAPGSPRNYFPAPDDPAAFTVDLLVSAVRQGRVLISGGAFARVSVSAGAAAAMPGVPSSAGIGETLTLAGETVGLNLHVEAIPEIDVSRIKVFVNCDQVLEVRATEPDGVIKYKGRVAVPVAKDSQIVVIGLGDKPIPREFSPHPRIDSPRFLSNPIYIDRGGDGWTPPGWDGCSYTP